jgi:4-amino-4-deoxy-L-arabinose transferase-like glycosyltransferase
VIGVRVLLARRPRLAAAAALVMAWGITLALDPWADEQVSDLGRRRQAAALFAQGLLPYRDVAWEYPPLLAPIVALTGILGTDEGSYRLGSALVTLGLALAVLWLCARLVARTGGSPGRAALAVALVPLLLGAVVRTHLDLAPVALVLLALVLVLEERPLVGSAVLGLAVMTKGFPLVILPVAAAWLVGRGELRIAVRAGLVLVATVVALALGAAALSPTGAAAALRYQIERPIQVESGPASALLAVEALGGPRAEPVSSHGSEGLEHPLAPVAALVGAHALGLVVCLLGFTALQRPGPRSLVLGSAAALVGAAAFGKVLSPQFMLWAVPLFALAMGWGLRLLSALVATAMALTLVEFPSRYFDLVARDAVAVGVVAARNVLLVAAVAAAVTALWGGAAKRRQ